MVPGRKQPGLAMNRSQVRSQTQGKPQAKGKRQTPSRRPRHRLFDNASLSSDLCFQWHDYAPALSFVMASEVSVIEPEALQSRVRELRRFL